MSSTFAIDSPRQQGDCVHFSDWFPDTFFYNGNIEDIQVKKQSSLLITRNELPSCLFVIAELSGLEKGGSLNRGISNEGSGG